MSQDKDRHPQQPDIDLNMPEMDGLTLLSKLPEINAVLNAVVITAYGDMADIRTAMHRGRGFRLGRLRHI